MRILIDYRPALRQRTGVGEYAHRLAEALVRELGSGGSLTLFSSSWRDRLPRDVIPGAAVVDRRVPVKLLNFAWHRAEWPAIESLTRRRYDVVQSSHPLLMPSRRAASFVTIHDLDFLDHPDRTSAEIRRDYPTLAASHAQRAHGVVVSSVYGRTQVETRLGVPAQRIVLCPAGAPEWEPRPEPQPDGPILFVGTIEPRKNVQGLIAAYKRLLSTTAAPDLLLAGRMVGGHWSFAADARVGVRLRPLGYVSDEERMRLYRTATMLVLPSFEEGFGLPVLEAMAIGLPVIVSNRGSLPELVGDAALIVDPDDHDAIANAMRRVLSDAALRQRMRDAGLQRARGYRWSASARRLLDAYRNALAGRGVR